jgi:hypothetical protein
MVYVASGARGVEVDVPGMGVSVGVKVTVGLISIATEVQVGALVRVGEGRMVSVGVQVGGCWMMVAVGVGVW